MFLKHYFVTVCSGLLVPEQTVIGSAFSQNFSAPDSPFIHILDRLHDLSPYNLQDGQFISMWFQIKLKPRLSTLTTEYLLCLSSKPFSCMTYQILYVYLLSSTLTILSTCYLALSLYC